MIAYVDSSVWINRFEGLADYPKIVENHLRTLEREGWTLCASEAVLLEVLFKPYKNNQLVLVELYLKTFTQIDVLSNYDGLLRDALSLAPEENLRQWIPFM